MATQSNTMIRTPKAGVDAIRRIVAEYALVPPPVIGFTFFDAEGEVESIEFYGVDAIRVLPPLTPLTHDCFNDLTDTMLVVLTAKQLDDRMRQHEIAYWVLFNAADVTASLESSMNTGYTETGIDTRHIDNDTDF